MWPPTGWWEEYGGKAGKLQEVAMRVLSIPASSASGERVFSALKHIWSPKRARMLMGRAAMLTYVYFNKRVMDRSTAPIASAGDWESMMDAMDEDVLASATVVMDVGSDDDDDGPTEDAMPEGSDSGTDM